MSLCEHAYYKDNEKFYPRLYCRISENWCPYTKRCQKVEKFIPIDDDVWEECDRYIMERRKNIPEGSYFVQATRPNKQGKLFLYVLIEENKVEKIFSNLTKLEQDYIYLDKVNGVYKTSLEPFKKENKVNENITIHVNEELVNERKRGRKKTKKENTPVEVVKTEIEETEDE